MISAGRFSLFIIVFVHALQDSSRHNENQDRANFLQHQGAFVSILHQKCTVRQLEKIHFICTIGFLSVWIQSASIQHFTSVFAKTSSFDLQPSHVSSLHRMSRKIPNIPHSFAFSNLLSVSKFSWTALLNKSRIFVWNSWQLVVSFLI